MVVLDQVVLDSFRHTAQHAYDQVLALFAEGMEELQAVQDFLLGVVADGAGVHEYGIGLFQAFTRAVACHLHDGSNHFTVCHVHLASVSFDKQFLVF